MTILDSIGRYQAATSMMINDAWNRGLVFKDFEHLDTHPSSIELEKKFIAQTVEYQCHLHNETRFAFIGLQFKTCAIKKAVPHLIRWIVAGATRD